MKNKTIKILLPIFFSCMLSIGQLSYSQEGDTTQEGSLLPAVLKQLNLNETDINRDLYIEGASPYSASHTCMVIPIYTGDKTKDHSLDAHVVLTDNTTGKIVNHQYEPGVYDGTAPLLIAIGIDTVKYELNDTAQAYGIRFYYTMHSRVSPYETTELSLFASHNGSFRKVLNRYTVSEYTGSVDDQDISQSWFTSLESAVIVDKKKTNGFYVLAVRDAIISEFSCTEEEKHLTQRLEYNGTEYPFEERNIYQLRDNN